jgi:predicted lipoprotein with Yx(FWY)xxD motif
VVGLVAVTLLLSACAAPTTEPAAEPTTGATASDVASETTTPAPTKHQPSPTASPDPSGVGVIAADSDFGTMLYGADGQAIYLFDLEDSTRPRCYDECADAWPPVLTTGDPVAGRGVRSALLGTVERRDGTRQVTYAGHPLYFYAHEDPWQVLCHDFEDFGGTWYVVQPDGAAVA